MPLKYPDEWKFDEFPHRMPVEAHRDFLKLVKSIVKGFDRPKAVYEEFKTAFGDTGSSSDVGWAESDMMSAMNAAMENAAMYVVSFYTALEGLRERNIAVPNDERINKILAEHDVPLVIERSHLILKAGDIEFVPEGASDEVKATAFVLGEEIGRGGFGVVYEVMRHTKIGKYRYAMKVLEPHVFNPKPERALPRFEREMKALSKLQHRAIVTLLEAGIGPDQKLYLLMPFIEGDDLRKSLSGATPRRVGAVFDEVLNALEFAHGRDVIHRDLSPDNIKVRKADDQPIILDFGCAYLLDEADTKLTTSLIGKSPYIPPEVHSDPTHKDIRQDVYACGVMLYEVIAQRLPRPDDYRPLGDDFKRFNGIDAVIQAALAPERKRIANAAKFREMLDEIELGN